MSPWLTVCSWTRAVLSIAVMVRSGAGWNLASVVPFGKC